MTDNLFQNQRSKIITVIRIIGAFYVKFLSDHDSSYQSLSECLFSSQTLSEPFPVESFPPRSGFEGLLMSRRFVFPPPKMWNASSSSWQQQGGWSGGGWSHGGGKKTQQQQQQHFHTKRARDGHQMPDLRTYKKGRFQNHMEDFGGGAKGIGAAAAADPDSHCLSLDIDGTLADIDTRIAHAASLHKEGSPQYWAVLLDGQHYPMDTPILEAREFVKRWLEGGAGDINTGESPPRRRLVVYVSGRRTGTESQTRAWLDKYGFPGGEIKHRPKGFRSLEWKAVEIRKLCQKYGQVTHIGDREDDVEAAKQAGARPIKVEANKWLTREQAEAGGVLDIIDVFREDG